MTNNGQCIRKDFFSEIFQLLILLGRGSRRKGKWGGNGRKSKINLIKKVNPQDRQLSQIIFQATTEGEREERCRIHVCRGGGGRWRKNSNCWLIWTGASSFDLRRADLRSGRKEIKTGGDLLLGLLHQAGSNGKVLLKKNARLETSGEKDKERMQLKSIGKPIIFQGDIDFR